MGGVPGSCKLTKKSRSRGGRYSMRTAFSLVRGVHHLLAFVGTAALLGAACSPAAPPPAATAAPAAAAANQPATGEPIKLGYVWGVTGAVAEIVRPASEATKAFWDDLNKKGGIKGHPVQMIEIDS